jgi:pilus assembly protein CpaF
MINFLLIVVTIIAIAAILFYWFTRKRVRIDNREESRFDLGGIQIFIAKAFQDLISSSIYVGSPTEEEYNRRKARRNELRKALRRCMHGDISSKKYVKLYMKNMLVNTFGFTEINVNLVIPFDRAERLSSQECYDILIYEYQKEHGPNAFKFLIQKYKLDDITKLPDGSKGYRITSEQMREIYLDEKLKLSFDDKLNVIVQRVYQSYKGLGVIDELRDQNINGVNGGTSGLPPDVVQALDAADYFEQKRSIPHSYDAVWMFYQGKSIHLEFLSHGSELELKRVVNNIYGFGNPKQLNQANAYVVNDMADGSRVAVVRPTMAESWAYFVRKFDDDLVELEDQIKGENAELPIGLLIYLILGQQIMAITGRQGAGKTTLLKALIGYIVCKNIRIQEMSFEMWARRLFPHKNILTFRETTSISGQEGLDFQKKTDGAVNILSEAAKHSQISQSIQMMQTGSDYTLVTHHGVTLKKLINSWRNSLVANGDFLSEKEAEKQVVEVLAWNTHLELSGSGQRDIGRISEVIPVEEITELPKEYKNKEMLVDKLDAFMDTMVAHYESMNPKTYDYNHIVVYENGKYVAKNPISETKIKDMISKMDEEDAAGFVAFLAKHWGNAA